MQPRESNIFELSSEQNNGRTPTPLEDSEKFWALLDESDDQLNAQKKELLNQSSSLKESGSEYYSSTHSSVFCSFSNVSIKEALSNSKNSSERINPNISLLRNEIQFKKKIGKFLEEFNNALKIKYKISAELVELGKIGNGSFGEVTAYFDCSQKTIISKKIVAYSKWKKGIENTCYREILAILYLNKNGWQEALKVYQLGFETKDRFAFYMEFRYGTLEDLLRFVNSSKVVYEKFMLELRIQLYSQVAFLKSLSICHRDITPSNIIVRKGMKFILCDYGLSLIGLKDEVQELPLAGTHKYWPSIMEKSYQNKKFMCFINPYEVDRYYVSKVCEEVQKYLNDWREQIVVIKQEEFEKLYISSIKEKIYRNIDPKRKSDILKKLQDFQSSQKNKI